MKARFFTKQEIKVFNLCEAAKDNEDMPLFGPASAGPGSEPAFALGVTPDTIVTRCDTAKDARALPAGSVVGDVYGGLTFTDEVAAVLESRSYGGWQEIELVPGEHWTIITLSH